METKFNFKSAICTDKIQSERLLALGLKKETADMEWFHTKSFGWSMMSLDGEDIIQTERHIPAWSLHRLIEMALKDILICGISFTFNEYAYEKVIQIIEHQIKEGYFPKEYLV